jgi:hypothetical protein
MRARYEDISHFRAPYKDSVFSGFGVYEQVAPGAETHGTGEYVPVSGLGETNLHPLIAGSTTVVPPGWVLAPTPEPTAAGVQQPATAPAGPLFESEGHLVFSTPAGAAMFDAMLSPWAQKPTAQAIPLSNGDIGVLWWVGYDVPPPEAGPAAGFVPFAAIMGLYPTGYVVLSETSLVNPTPAKRSFVVTKNAKTVADNAREGGLYFITRGGDQKVIDAAKALVTGGFSLAALGPTGTALLVVGGAAVLYYAFGRKKRAA